MKIDEIIQEAHEIVKRDAGKLGLPPHFAFDPKYHKDEFTWAASLLNDNDLDGVYDDDGSEDDWF